MSICGQSECNMRTGPDDLWCPGHSHDRPLWKRLDAIEVRIADSRKVVLRALPWPLRWPVAAWLRWKAS